MLCVRVDVGSDICKLKALTSLDLSQNSLTELPAGNFHNATLAAYVADNCLRCVLVSLCSAYLRERSL